MDDNKGRSRNRKTFLEQLTFSKDVKKTLALLMATVIMLTGVDFTGITQAYAATNETQIVKQGEEKTVENRNLKISKKVSVVNGTENKFKVTLTVDTAEDISQIAKTEDAAVILLIDKSNSMQETIDGKSASALKDQRITKAKIAAHDFIENFSKIDDEDAVSAKRLVSVIEFGTDASVKKSSNKGTTRKWFDVTNSSDLETVIGRQTNVTKQNPTGRSGGLVNSITVPNSEAGATNIAGALKLAYELIDDAQTKGTFDSVSNVNVILLTDGAPTCRISNSKGDTVSGSYDSDGQRAFFATYEPVDGTNASGRNREHIASDIKGTVINGSNVTLYSIAFATGKAKFQTGYNKYEDKSIYEWLDSFSNVTYNSSEADQLQINFNKILAAITVGVKAWNVEDPMAENIIYQGKVAGDKNAVNASTLPNKKTELLWDIKNSPPSSTYKEGDKTHYQYKMEYYAALDTTDEKFDYDKVYDTNEKTTLSYFLYSTMTEEDTPVLKYIDFDVPQVKGFPGSFQFTKVAEDGQTPLAGAEFTLTGTATGSEKSVVRKAVSTDNGAVSFTNLPAGKYELKETEAPKGFQSAEEEKDVTVSYGAVTPQNLIGSKYKNEAKKKTIIGYKIWSGDKEEAGLRKVSDITLTLYQVEDDGAEVATNYKATWIETTSDTWIYEFKDVPEFDINGNAIKYKVKETLKDGSPFTPEYDKDNTTITNKIKAGKLFLKKSLAENQPAIDGDEFTLSVSGKFSDTKNGYKDFVFTSNPTEKEFPVNRVIKIAGVIEGEEYTVSETSYNEDRYEKTAITENAKAVAPSAQNVPVLEIKNTLKAGVLSVKKEIAAGTDIKPEDSFVLHVNGKFNDKSTYKEFTFAKEKNMEQSINKVGTVVSVPNTIVGETYTVEEITKPDRYVPAITADSKQAKKSGPPEVLIVTNAARSGKVTIKGEKTWVNNNDITPESITIYLYQNRTDDSGPLKSVTLKKGANKYTFENIPRYNTFGEEYNYTVDEELPNGYTKKITGYNIENEYTGGETVTISGTKEWIRDNVDEDVEYPDVTLGLYRNSEETAVQKITLKNGEKDFIFKPAEKYAPDGSEYSYKVKEASVNGYISEVKGTEKNKFIVTNTYTPGTIDIEGKKIWDVPAGTKEYPTVTVQLWRGGEDIGKTTTIKNGETSFMFTDLPEYAPNGEKYNYTVTEVKIPGYNAEINGYTIENKYKPETTEIAVRKVWKDVPAGETHPDAKISLWREEEGKEDTVIATHTLADSETYTFKSLPTVSTAGKAYTYYVAETEIKGYESEKTNEGGVVVFTNTYTGGSKIRVEGKKTWNVPEGTTQFPEITIQLRQGGNKMPGKIATIKGGGTSYSFENLPEYAPNGEKYVYTVEEEVPTGYKLTIPDKSKPLELVNTFDDTTIDISGQKIWTNPDDPHPEVTINLYQSGSKKIFKTTTLKPDNTYSFEDLPKYSMAGIEYQYTVEEVVPSGYTKLDPVEGDGEYDFRNGYTPDTTSVTVTKLWENMPENAVYPSVTFHLKRGEKQIREHTIEGGTTAPSSYTFANLPKQAPNGTDYIYTVEEVPIAGYTTPNPEVNGSNVTFTNTYTPGSTSVSGTKKWVGVSESEKHPKITIQLLQNGNPMPDKVKELEYPDVEYSFDNLPEYATNGQPYQYTIEEKKENKIDGYTTTYNEAHLNVTNTYAPGSTKVSGTKTWSNPGDPHPEVTVILKRSDGEEVDRTKADPVTGKYEFDSLPIFATDGTRYTYTVEEEKINGYESQVTSYDIHNTYQAGETSVKVTKNWKGLNGAQHPAVTINLMRDDKPAEAPISVKLGAGTGMSQEYTFDKLPKYAPDGTEYSYTVEEVSVNGYTTAYDRSNPADIKITNTYTGDTSKKVEGTKTWTGLLEGTEHPAITIELFRSDNPSVAIASQTLEAGTHMNDSYSFIGLKKFDTLGNPYTYTVKESTVNGYESQQEGYNFVNKYTGGEEVTVKGTKAWENVIEGQPYPVATINLLQNGKEILDTKIENGGTEYSFMGLPKYDVNGEEYQYTVSEEKIDGYDSQQSGVNFTNTYTGGDKLDIKGTKTWKNVPAGSPYPVAYIDLYQGDTFIRTAEITNGGDHYEFRGLKEFDRAGNKYEYKVKEHAISGYTVTQNGYDFTNEYAMRVIDITGTKTWEGGSGDRPAITVKLFRDDDETRPYRETTLLNGVTTYKFENLPEYTTDGKKYIYTLDEADVNGYTKDIEDNSYNITNKYTGGDKVTVKGTKTWDIPDGIKVTKYPDVTIKLLQNGKETDQTVVLKDGNVDYSFDNLPKYAPNSEEYEYTVTEVVPNGYTNEIIGNDITNTYTGGEKVKIEGTKTWNVPEGTKEYPDVTIRLIRNGDETDKTYTITEGGNSYSFTDLPKYAPDGTEYKYTVQEEEPNGYKREQTGNDFVNTYTGGEPITITGKKTWNVPEGTTKFPESVTVELYQDTQYCDSTTIENGGDSYTFAGLPQYAVNGKPYEYTVKEVVPGGYTVTPDENDPYHLINTFNESTVYIEGTKTWDNPDAVHPEVTIQLWQDGVEYETAKVDPATNQYSFKDLPEYSTDGHKYAYTVSEIEVDGYTSIKEGEYNFINKYTPDKTSVTITKIWSNMPENMADKKYPEITFNLTRSDGTTKENAGSITLRNGETSYTFEDLDKYAPNSKPYIYEVTEEEVKGYTQAKGENNTFTNTYTPDESKTISGTKTWVGVPEGSLYPAITLNLYQSAYGQEKVFRTLVLRKGEKEYSFTKLPVYATDGTEFTYRVEEANVPNGYTVSYDPANPLNITNTYTGGEKISISGTKTWADNGNSAMVRPDSVTLKLYRLKGESNKIPVTDPSISWSATDSDVWHYTISNLPKYNTSGEEIVYMAEEEPVPSYVTTYDAENPLNITNTIDLGSLKVVKLLGENTEAKDEDRFTLTVSGKFADTTETTKEYIFANSSDSGHYTIGEEVNVTGVVNGETYTVSEATNAGDRFTSELTVGEAAAVSADASVVPVLTVTNTSRNGTTSISGTKTWKNVPADVEHPAVTIVLDRNGEFYEETTVKADNTYSFDNLPVYDPSGNPYQYSVREAEVDGYTSGKINDTDFVNSFQTTSVRIYGRKVLEGDLSLRENQFQFKLYEDGKLLKENIYNDADGTIDFGEIYYDVRDKGIHTYTLKEVNDDIEGMTYDDKDHTVEVLVDNPDGVYAAQIVSIDGNDYTEGDMAEFVNSYTTPTNDLIIQKFVAGASDETFEFEVTVNGGLFVGEYTLNNSDDVLTTDDGKIYLKANDKATLRDIEKGAAYVVKETDSKDHAVLANGEATDTVTGTMVSRRDSGTPVVEFTNIPKDKLVIAKTRVGGNERDLFRFSLKYSRANASDATPGDTATDSDSYDVGTSSNGKASSRKNFRTMLDDLFDNNGDPIYAFNGNYNLYAKDSDGKLVNKGTKKAEKGEIELYGGELAVVNGFVAGTNFEITEILDDDSDYRLSEFSVENPYKGTIATSSNAVLAEAADVAEAAEFADFANLVDFVNVFKYSEIRTRYTLRTVDADGNFNDKAEGSIPSSGYAKFEVDSDLADVEAKYLNSTYKVDNKENAYDLVSVEVIKISLNGTETTLYSETGDTIGNALSEFNIHDLEKDAVYRINIDYIRMKGSVVLTKTSIDGKLLEGAKFQLYNELGDKVGEVHTTGKDGRIVVENLLPGSYYFVEAEAPKGYVKDETPVEFELSAGNGKIKTAECSMTNELGTGSVVLKKVDIDGNGLAGVSFDLYNSDGVEVQTGLQTNAEGQIRVDGLEIGSYYFVEQSTLPGFVMDDSQIHFEITFADIESGAPVTLKPFINHYEENGIIVLTKTDRNGIALSNAAFDLYKEGMANPVRTNLITGADGKITVTGLSVGNYYFVETKAPAGYITPTGGDARTSALTVNFAENIRDGKAVEVTVVNDLQTGSVSLRKTNIDGSKALAGAEFSLYSGNDILIKAGLVTDANGIITYDNLPVGAYYFRETKAPDGYVLPTGDEAITSFTVKFGEEATLSVTNTAKPSGGGSNGGGGSSNDGRTRGDTTGGPGAAIPDTPVPLANLPGGSGDSGIVINDGMVPLAALPKTGDSPFKGLMALFTGLLLGLAALFGKKKKEDEQ